MAEAIPNLELVEAAEGGLSEELIRSRLIDADTVTDADLQLVKSQIEELAKEEGLSPEDVLHLVTWELADKTQLEPEVVQEITESQPDPRIFKGKLGTIISGLRNQSALQPA